MIDQATELRKLVLRAIRDQPVVSAPPPRLVCVMGARRGVGSTTVATNLAAAFAGQGVRVVLVDVDMYRSDVANFCGVDSEAVDLRRAAVHQDIHEFMVAGPAGIQIVPRLSSSAAVDETSSQRSDCDMSFERLQRQLATLGRHADAVVLDLGSGASELARRFAPAADDVLLVTTPDDVAVMDAYARIKTDLSLASQRSLQLLVNRVTGDVQAEDVHRRVDASCRKFLDTTVGLAGCIPFEECVHRASICRVPVAIAEPTARSSQAFDQLVSVLLASRDEAHAA